MVRDVRFDIRADYKGRPAFSQAKADLASVGAGVKGVNAQLQSGAQFIRSFGAGLAGGLVIGGLSEIPRAVRETVREVANLVDTAQKIGIGVEALQEFQFAAKQTGVEAAQMDAALSKFSVTVGDASRGGGELAEILKLNGVAIRDATGNLRPLDDLLMDVADLVKNAASDQERAIIVTKAFGRANDELINTLRGGSAGLRQMRAEARELGVVTQEVADEAAELDDRMERVSQRLGTHWKNAKIKVGTATADMIDDFLELQRVTDDFWANPNWQNFADMMFGEGAGAAIGVPAPPDPGDVRKQRETALRAEAQGLVVQIEEAKAALADLQAQQDAGGFVSVGAMQTAAQDLENLRSQFALIITEVIRLQQESAQAGEAMADAFEKARIAAQQNAAQVGRVTVLPPAGAESADTTAALIKRFEGYRPSAKWDVNAYRLGYGSDTMTDPSGRVTPVTASSTTTTEAAERDLERRIAEFQQVIIGQIGDAFGQLTEPVQAALTSVAYNYGSLPDSVAAAARTTDTEAIAQSIEALPANPQRRREEAEIARTGEFGLTERRRESVQAAEEEARAAEERVKAREALIAGIEEEIAALGLEAQAFGQTTFEAEKAKVAFDLLNQAKAAGLEITPELTAKINELAASYANATVQVEQLELQEDAAAEAQERLADKAANARDTVGGVLDTITEGLKQGAEAGDILKDVILDVADAFIQMSKNAFLDFMFPSTAPGATAGAAATGIGGFFSSLFGFEKGGIMTKHGPLPLNFYDKGGIANHPQLAMFGEGRMNEAYVPLPDGRRIPVDLRAPQVPDLSGMAQQAAWGGGRQAMDVTNRVLVDPSPLFHASVQSETRRMKDETLRAVPGYLADRQGRAHGGRPGA